MCWRGICSWIHHLSSGSYWYSLKCLEDDLYNIAWCIFTLSISVLNCPDNCSTEVLYLLLLYFTSCLTLWWCSWLLTGNTWCYLFREIDPMTNCTISRLFAIKFYSRFLFSNCLQWGWYWWKYFKSLLSDPLFISTHSWCVFVYLWLNPSSSSDS